MDLLQSVITLHLLLMPNVLASPTATRRFTAGRHSRRSDRDDTAAAHKITVRNGHNAVPEQHPSFMVHLYQQLADRHGHPRQDVHNGLATQSTAIWSFKNTAASHLSRASSSYIGSDLEFHFHDLPKKADILSAELRLFKTVAAAPGIDTVRKCHITISQLSEGKEVTLMTRETTALRSGWETFNLTQLIEGARQNTEVRLKVRITGAFGQAGPYPPSMQQKFINKLQPLLVVYLAQYNSNEADHEWEKLIASTLKQLNKHHTPEPKLLSRHDREAVEGGDDNAKQGNCSIKNMSVNFTELGIDIVLPEVLNLKSCSGICSPVHSIKKAHTLIKYYLHVRLGLPLHLCCVPDKFDAIRVLAKKRNGSIVLETYPHAMVKKCTCL